MFSLSQYMINYGVPQETLVLLLMLPIIATIIAFARQVIGIKGFGIYTPLLVSIALVSMGLKYGLAIFTIILIIGTLSRLLIQKAKLRLLYLPRMAIIVIAVAFSVLILLLGSTYLDLYDLTQVSVLAILIMITLTEKFLISQIQRSKKEAAVLTMETLFLSVICYLIASWNWLENIVLIYPLGVILATLLANIALGKWTGLRLYEYYRFREVIKRVELPGKK